MYDHQITVYCYRRAVSRIWSNKICFIFVLCPRFGDYRMIQSPTDGRATEPGGNSHFPFLVPNHTIFQGLASTRQLLVSIALNPTAAEPYLLFPLIWPQSACFIQQCFRQGATRLISAYVTHTFYLTMPVLAFLSFSLIEPY